jgi:hypothetical protein
VSLNEQATDSKSHILLAPCGAVTFIDPMVDPLYLSLGAKMEELVKIRRFLRFIFIEPFKYIRDLLWFLPEHLSPLLAILLAAVIPILVLVFFYWLFSLYYWPWGATKW